MATDLRGKSGTGLDADRVRSAPVRSAWPYILGVFALIAVAVAAGLLLTQRQPGPARVRTGSYADLARTEAREGGPYAQVPDSCSVIETIPGRGGPPVKFPCGGSGETAEKSEGKNWVEVREGGPYACTVSLPRCWDPNA